MDFHKLKSRVKKYWVMAEIGNLQFVMARSKASGVLFMICVISYYRFVVLTDDKLASDYKWSVYLVFWAQCVGMFLCTVMSLGRLLVALIHGVLNIRRFTISIISIEIKNYKIKRLVEWKKKLPPLHIRGQKLRKIIYHIRNLLINICIGSQIVIVIVNKLLVPISIAGFLYLTVIRTVKSPLGSLVLLIIPLSFLLFICTSRMRIIRLLAMLKKFLFNPNESEHVLGYEQDLRNFVLPI